MPDPLALAKEKGREAAYAGENPGSREFDDAIDRANIAFLKSLAESAEKERQARLRDPEHPRSTEDAQAQIDAWCTARYIRSLLEEPHG